MFWSASRSRQHAKAANSPDEPDTTWRRRRTRRVLFWAVVGALVLDGIVLAILHLGSPKPPPRSVLFAGSPAIHELQAVAAEQPRDAEWRLRLGSEYLRAGHYLSAIESFSAALSLGGAEATARRGLATAYSRVDRYAEALEELRRLRELEPHDLGLRIKAAEAYQSLDRPKETRAVLDSIPRDGRGYPQLGSGTASQADLERLATAYGRAEAWSQSLALAETLLRDCPGSQGGHVAAGQALLALGRPGEAVAHLRAALVGRAEPTLQLLLADALDGETRAQRRPEDDAEIRRLLEAVVKAGSPPVRTFYLLGSVYEREHQWERAARCFETTVAMEFREEESQRHLYQDLRKTSRRDDSIYQEARYYEGKHLFPRAEALYRQLMAQHPGSEAGYFHLSRAQIKAGDLRGALATLMRAKSLPGGSPEVYPKLANVYGLLGDRARRVEAWQEFIRRAPAQAVRGYQGLGDAADDGGDMDGAEAYYRKCVQLAPSSDRYRVHLAEFLLDRRNRPEKLREAVQLLEETVKLGSEDAAAFFRLGIAYRHSGRTQEAIWSLRHAIDLEPGDGRSYQPLGEVLLAAGRRQEGQEALALFKRYREFDQALETLRVRVKRNPRDLESLRRLAALYERSGALHDAVSACSQILTVTPTDARARRRLEALRQRLGEEEESGSSRPADGGQGAARG